MEQKKPNFIRSIKQTSLFILGLMVLNVLIKLLFNQSDFQDLKKDFLALDNRVLGIFIFLLVIIVGWIIVSLIIGSIYYVIQTIKYKKVD
ncbi:MULTISPECIES: hypothetical protein [Lactococcus]|jgi:hypothetical protein|uniref:hypothetical protein n=2 Tax=Bacteria TaxID=2 RepID=UPI0010BEA405|nr:hypothetical protein [Lactococcus lactis]MDN6266170.1 hypothetical protein [Tetragenococcus halophilus]MDN6294725.1 hypothetical protein [Alkalibacterium sp.]MDN6424158.1 hypothetical protein [Tetragenococcus koreensis]MCT1227442.1 hypothetical protein [Lactococcus lactis]MCT3108695.1 hypothetical protein [Lactococcus lactis]